MIVEQETPWTYKREKKEVQKNWKKLDTEKEENKGFLRPKNCKKTVHVRVSMDLEINSSWNGWIIENET
jgi:hypothetical protein